MKMDPDKFWKLTPAEFAVMVDALEQDHVNKINELLFVAWHTAYFTREPKPPMLKDVLISKEKKPQKEQTPEQMVVACKMITAALGGTFIEVN